MLNNAAKGLEMSFLSRYSNLLGILFGPSDLFILKVAISSEISVWHAGIAKKEESLGLRRYLEK